MQLALGVGVVVHSVECWNCAKSSVAVGRGGQRGGESRRNADVGRAHALDRENAKGRKNDNHSQIREKWCAGGRLRNYRLWASSLAG